MRLADDFARDGYAIARRLFTSVELAELKAEFEQLHARGSIPDCFDVVPGAQDPLDRYPRMMHPHRVSDLAMHYMLHPRLEPILRELMGETPVAAQSMF